MRISPHKHRVCAVPFPRPPVKFVRLSLSCYAMRTLPLKHLCHVIQYYTLLLQFVYAYAYALMRNLPHKHRVCECFSLGLPFLKRLYSNVCRILLRVFSLIIIGFVQCLSLGPLLSLYAYLCHVMLCVLCLSNIYVMSFSVQILCCFNSFMRTLMRLCVICLTNIGFVSAFPSGSLFLNVCTLMFVAFCYAYFPS